MAQKNNIRSIRFSDELAGLIESQPGDSFTQKFENLITKCYWELPAKEEELRRVQELIDRKRQQLNELEKTTVQLRRLRSFIDQADEYIRLIMVTTRDIAKTVVDEET